MSSKPGCPIFINSDWILFQMVLFTLGPSQTCLGMEKSRETACGKYPRTVWGNSVHDVGHNSNNIFTIWCHWKVHAAVSSSLEPGEGEQVAGPSLVDRNSDHSENTLLNPDLFKWLKYCSTWFHTDLGEAYMYVSFSTIVHLKKYNVCKDKKQSSLLLAIVCSRWIFRLGFLCMQIEDQIQSL